MLTSDSRLRAAVDAVYHSAVSPDSWPRTLALLSDMFGSTTAGFAFGRRHGGGGISLFVRSDPSWERLYAEYYAYRNPYQASEHLIREGLVTSGETFLPDAELVKTEYYADFPAKQDVLRTVAAFPIVRGDIASTIIFYRPARRPRYGTAEIELLRLLLPHLALGMRIHERFADLAHPMAAATVLSAEAPFGVMVLDKDGRVRLLNAAAARIIAMNDGLRLERSQLVLAHAGATLGLRRHVRSASQAAQPTSQPRGGTVMVPRHSSSRPFQLLVTPLDLAGNASFRGALVFVSNPAERPALNPERVQAALGLTAREAVLVVGLAAGRHLQDCARSAGVTGETARTHLRNIFRKTGVGSQPDLIALVLAIPGLDDRTSVA